MFAPKDEVSSVVFQHPRTQIAPTPLTGGAHRSLCHSTPKKRVLKCASNVMMCESTGVCMTKPDESTVDSDRPGLCTGVANGVVVVMFLAVISQLALGSSTTAMEREGY